MTADSSIAYEKHAKEFLQQRDNSRIGVQIVSTWARSLKPDSSVIDIACGGGLPVTQSLVDLGVSVWAIDSSPTLIDSFSKRFPEIPAECASVLDSDYFGRRFDAAISIGLVFLLAEGDQIRMLNRVSDMLNPGASFLFTAPIETGTWTDTNTGHGCISMGRDNYSSALEQAGFQIVKCHVDSGANNYYEVEKNKN